MAREEFKLPIPAITPIDETGYAREIDRISAAFAERAAKVEVTGRLREILATLERIGPATYRQVGMALPGYDDSRDQRRILSGRMMALVEYGHARIAGSTTMPSGISRYPKPSRLYEFVTYALPWAKHQVVLDRWLDRQLTKLEARLAMGRCVIGALPKALSSQQMDIMRRRAAGENLEDIAVDYGISRERVRQIVNVGINKARGAYVPTRGAKGIPLPPDLSEWLDRCIDARVAKAAGMSAIAPVRRHQRALPATIAKLRHVMESDDGSCLYRRKRHSDQPRSRGGYMELSPEVIAWLHDKTVRDVARAAQVCPQTVWKLRIGQSKVAQARIHAALTTAWQDDQWRENWQMPTG